MKRFEWQSPQVIEIIYNMGGAYPKYLEAELGRTQMIVCDMVWCGTMWCDQCLSINLYKISFVSELIGWKGQPEEPGLE